jgi:hypothetical protein
MNSDEILRIIMEKHRVLCRDIDIAVRQNVTVPPYANIEDAKNARNALYVAYWTIQDILENAKLDK